MSWQDGQWESGGIQNHDVFESLYVKEGAEKMSVGWGGYKREKFFHFINREMWKCFLRWCDLTLEELILRRQKGWHSEAQLEVMALDGSRGAIVSPKKNEDTETFISVQDEKDNHLITSSLMKEEADSAAKNVWVVE